MSTTLAALIQKEEDAIKLAKQAIANGQAAQAQVTTLTAIHGDLLTVKALKDTEGATAADRLAAASAGATKLGTDYKPGVDLVAKQLQDKSLTDAALQAEVGATLKAPLDTTKKYSDYVSAKNAADADVDAKTLDLTRSRRKALEERAKVNDQVAAIGRYLGSIEAKLGQAKALYASVGQLAKAGDTAGAWWALAQAKALVQEITGASAATLLTQLSDACDDYATAVSKALKDESDLATSVGKQALAASNLKIASGQVLAALKAKVAGP